MPTTRIISQRVLRQAPTIALTIALSLLSLVLLGRSAYSATRSDRDSHMVQCKPATLKGLFKIAYQGEPHTQFVLALMYSSGHCLEKEKPCSKTKVLK